MYLRNLKPENILIDSVARDAARKVYPGDRVSVQIVTADEEANKVMNVLQKGANESGPGLLVDPAGNVEIPLLGIFNVKGQTPNVIRDSIKKKLDELYKNATVYCNIPGRVVILTSLSGLSGSSQGAAGSGVASIPMLDERLTIPELLSGMRLSNVKLEKSWIIREIDGKRVVSKLNLNSAEILRSPFFYLRNNDIIYIEPRKFNLFLESNLPFRNLIGLFAGFSGLALAVVLALK
jgi:polysaccharide export outer membrane protein